MRITILILLAFACTFAGFSLSAGNGFTSNLTVPANQTFYLGGGQTMGYTANAKNIGQVAVTLQVQVPGSEPETLTVLNPGQKAKADVPAKAALLVLNGTGEPAEVVITAPSRVASLSMDYKGKDIK